MPTCSGWKKKVSDKDIKHSETLIIQGKTYVGTCLCPVCRIPVWVRRIKSKTSEGHLLVVSQHKHGDPDSGFVDRQIKKGKAGSPKPSPRTKKKPTIVKPDAARSSSDRPSSPAAKAGAGKVAGKGSRGE